MAKDIEKVVEWECHTNREITKWDYVCTPEFKDGKFPMYKCRCCVVGRYGTEIEEKEVYSKWDSY